MRQVCAATKGMNLPYKGRVPQRRVVVDNIGAEVAGGSRRRRPHHYHYHHHPSRRRRRRRRRFRKIRQVGIPRAKQ